MTKLRAGTLPYKTYLIFYREIPQSELRSSVALLEEVEELLPDQVPDRILSAEVVPDPLSCLALLDPDLVKLYIGHRSNV